MKRLHIILGLAVLACAHASYAKTTQVDYVEDIAKQISYVEKQTVWPGFHPASTPSVIQFEDDGKLSAYALNFTPGSQPWFSLPSLAGSPIYFLQDSAILNNTDDGKFAEIDGQRSFMILEDAAFFAKRANFINKYMAERAKYYIANESQIDDEHIKSFQLAYDNFNNATAIKLVYLEDAALTLAQQDDSAAAEDALRDAVAIHQYRNQLASQSAREYENANEIAKGVPVYISWNSKQLSEQDYRKMTQRTGCPPLNGMLDAKSMIECNNDMFPAFASSVFGHALDKKMNHQDWKKSVETQFKSISQVMIDSYHFTDQQAQSMSKLAMSKPAYHYDRIEQVVNRSMTSYLNAMHAAVDGYKSQSGAVLHIPVEYGEAIAIIGMFHHVYDEFYLVNSNTTLFKDVNIDLPLREDGNGEHLIINNMPYVDVVAIPKNLSGEMDEDKSFAGFKLSDKAELIIDGRRMLASQFLNAKKVQEFNNLLIKDEKLNLPFPAHGELDASHGILKVKFAADKNVKFSFKAKR